MSSPESNDQETRVDGMSLGILMDKETGEYVDYVFLADVWAKDPRFRSRWMLIGQHRGLFRVGKASMDVSLLRPMSGDNGDARFRKAAGKVLSEWRRLGAPPKSTQYASG